MVTFNDTRRTFEPTAPKPEVKELLADIPGGEPGLLPAALIDDDLKVWFTVPLYSDPETGREKYELFVDDETDAITTRYWTTPIGDSDRYLELPKEWLRKNDGQHRIYYKTTIYNDAENYSFDLVMTLDTGAPVLSPNSKLIFPSEVLPPANQLTAYYLHYHDDQLKADIPGYTSPRPWDRITWFWGKSPGDLDPGGVIELDDQNYADPVVLTIEGQLIRDRGDGKRYVSYQVQDRAGNTSSTPSVAVELDVAATPIPRTLPWPLIELAAGTGEQQTLDPLQATTGAVVKIPDEAVIYPGEKVWVQWGEPDSLGHRRIDRPISTGQRRYQIDMPAVAAHIGKTLWVDYGVIDERDEEYPSTRRKLQVQTIPANRLEPVKCEGLSGGSLSYRLVATNGAKLTLTKWSLITTDQHILITMTGVGSSGLDSVFQAIPKRAVTAQEAIGGIGHSTEVRVPKTFLNTLRRNAPLTGKVYVSFDGGKTWPPLAAPNFPLLQLTLID